MIESEALLRDPTTKPTDEIIFAGLADAASSYQAFITALKQQAITLMDWRFYSDGKAWLTKGEYKWTTSRGTEKVKPIFWLSIWKGFFKVSFNFKAETRDALLELPLTKKTKEMIQHLETNGKKMKYLGVIFDVTNEDQLEDIYILADFRKKNI